MMAGGAVQPRKSTTSSTDDTTSAHRRSLEAMEKRKEMWERRMQARAELDERGFFDWIGGFFDGSSNCYVAGYPALVKTCPSTSSPYIRSPVSLRIGGSDNRALGLLLVKRRMSILERRLHCPRFRHG